MSEWVLLFVILDEFKEGLGASFLKKSHERGRKGLHFSGGHFGYFSVFKNIRGRNLQEIQVARNVGVCQNTDELACRHHKLGHQINIVITLATIFCRRRGILATKMFK